MDYRYIIFLILAIFLIFRLYVKITYKFWAYQPVFHYYNLFYWIYPKGIINKDLPIANKYCNYIDITTKNFLDISTDELTSIVSLLSKNYYREKNISYIPTAESFSADFIGHIDPTFISTYNKTIYDQIEGKINKENKIIGVITGKPVTIKINKIILPAYYVDYLCVDKLYRNQNIAPQLIQTYEYSQRHKNQKSAVSLFKREGVLTGIVPLTAYKAKQYYISTIPKQLDNNNVIKIHTQNYYLLEELLKSIDFFDCVIQSSLSHLLNLIKEEIYIVYGFVNNAKLSTCYFFKLNNTIYHETELYTNNKKESTCIDLIASINTVDENNFIDYFLVALKKVNKDYNYINIEEISSNYIITHYLNSLSLIPRITMPIAYFYYNYAKRPVTSDKVLILT